MSESSVPHWFKPPLILNQLCVPRHLASSSSLQAPPATHDANGEADASFFGIGFGGEIAGRLWGAMVLQLRPKADKSAAFPVWWIE